jgi:hypothetical protein
VEEADASMVAQLVDDAMMSWMLPGHFRWQLIT